MKALVTEQKGPPETLILRDMPLPEPGAMELRIRVQACGINYPDVLMIEDKYQFHADRPFAPGIEISGIVDALGEGATSFAIGARVVAQIDHGGLAEFAIARADAAHVVPEGIAPEQAASMLLTYATAFHALRDRAAVRSGEHMLVMGAGGGVGLAAIDLGKAMGAHVVAAVSSEAKGKAAIAAGADELILYPAENPDSKQLSDRFKQVRRDGFDVVFDPVGGPYAQAAVRCLAWEGRYLVVGFAAGIPAPPLNLVLLKGSQIMGVFWGSFATRAPDRARALVAELLDMLRTGQINPPAPQIFTLAEGGHAIAALRGRTAVGKLVVKP